MKFIEMFGFVTFKTYVPMAEMVHVEQ
jgi:hypothetical protein